MVSFEEFPISTSNYVPGYKVVEVKGFVYGLTVRARGLGGDIGAGLKGILGGEIKQYVTMMEDSRDESVQRCIEHAKDLGANAIISLRIRIRLIHGSRPHFGRFQLSAGRTKHLSLLIISRQARLLRAMISSSSGLQE